MALIGEIPKAAITAHVEAFKAKQAATLPVSAKPLSVVLVESVKQVEAEAVVEEAPEVEPKPTKKRT